MISNLQKLTAEAIVNIFETSKVLGDYGKVTLLAGDTGHLTYGRSQTTLGSGNLFLLIRDYCDAEGAEFADELSAFLDALRRRDNGLDHNVSLKRMLREAGDDPVMRAAQNAFFDRVYWQPAVRRATNVGISEPLGTAVVFDSTIHGSWRLIRDRVGDSQQNEKAWVQRYVDERRAWLGNHSNRLLQKTVYRMDEFKKIIEAANWRLDLPLKVRGLDITEEILLNGEPVRPSAAENERNLRLTRPFMEGEDVREIQEALNRIANAGVTTDGVFGPRTEKAIRDFQTKEGLIADGIVGSATRAALDL